MTEFEKNLILIYTRIFYVDNINRLKNEGVIDFPLTCVADFSTTPFRVFNDLYNHVVEMLNTEPNQRAFIALILKNAYYSFYLNHEPNDQYLRELIEKADFKTLIHIFFSDELSGTALIKGCLKFLTYRIDDPAYEEIITDDINKANNAATLEKLKKEETSIKYRSGLLREILYEYLTIASENSIVEEDLYQKLDDYFLKGIVPLTIKNKYPYFFEQPEVAITIMNEQIKLLYEVVFMHTRLGLFMINESLVKHLNKLLRSSKDWNLPSSQKLRQELYDMFFSYHYDFTIGEDILKLSTDDLVILKQINPYYLLDLAEMSPPDYSQSLI